MKIKKDFILREVAGSWIVVPIGTALVNFNGMITLNETGAFLWRALEIGADEHALVKALTSEYNVSLSTAETDIGLFIKKMKEIGCLEE